MVFIPETNPTTETSQTTGAPLNLPQWNGEIFQFADVNQAFQKINGAMDDRMIRPYEATAGEVAVFDSMRNVVAGTGSRKLVQVWAGTITFTDSIPAVPPVISWGAGYRTTDREFIAVWDGTYMYGVRIADVGNIVFQGLYPHSNASIGIRSAVLSYASGNYRIMNGFGRHLVASGVSSPGGAGTLTAIYALRT